jgi:hypothetical protein
LVIAFSDGFYLPDVLSDRSVLVPAETHVAVGYYAGRLVFDGFDGFLADDRIATPTESTLELNGLQYSGSDSMSEP